MRETGIGERLERLESRLMSAEDQIDALNQSVYRQQQLLDRLQAHVLQLAQQLQGAQAAAQGRPEDEIPPHW
ncbi:MAG: SlyX family protein [Azoarcus sp.]|jgi:SlyX protein|nr:SlyX family protein [Azoarcus sp.]